MTAPSCVLVVSTNGSSETLQLSLWLCRLQNRINGYDLVEINIYTAFDARLETRQIELHPVSAHRDCGKLYSPLALAVVSLLTPVASLVSVTLTPASTAPLESETRPRIRRQYPAPTSSSSRPVTS